MSRLNDDLAKAFQLVNGIGAAPGVDVNARLQALQQLQAQMDRVMRGLREEQADQLKSGRVVSHAQLLILRHALGVGDNGDKSPYRNRFVTGAGSKDFDDCLALVDQGYMARHSGSMLTGGDDLFMVTEKGERIARIAEAGA